MSDDETLRYPIGRFTWPKDAGPEKRAAWLATLETAPSRLREAVSGLNDAQLDTPYRPGGWTVRQVVHHLPDSHMNSYVRFRLALTEDTPTIRGYEEQLWAELPDAKSGPLELSLVLLDALHERWVALLKMLTGEQYDRTFRHPDLGEIPLRNNLALYAWHSDHHIAHITRQREREGW